ncbi:MAG: LamG-like jellyroll fold domain-containing protein [Candidatus Promineifilaceae bacterium]|nr:LamG-like jellyroll fold domain-containing protein [Candidatus Promineifilaceae bacterium]
MPDFPDPASRKRRRSTRRALPGADEREASRPRIPRVNISEDIFEDVEEKILRQLILRYQNEEALGAGLFLTPVSAYLNLPALRAFWPLSSHDHNGNAYDLSGQGRTLTPTAVTYDRQRFASVAIFEAGSNSMLERADEPGLSITGDLSLGCWLAFDGSFSYSSIAGKWSAGGAGGESFELHAYFSAGEYYVEFSTHDGVTQFDTTLKEPSGGVDFLNTWLFVAATIDTASQQQTVRLNTSTRTTAAPAALQPTAAAFSIGYSGYAGSYLGGRVASPFLCASALPAATLEQLFHATRHIFGR